MATKNRARSAGETASTENTVSQALLSTSLNCAHALFDCVYVGGPSSE